MNPSKPFGWVYVITNNLNGKSYVGQTTRGIKVRWEEHIAAVFSEVQVINSALAKYGPQNFSVREIDTADSRETLDSKEIHWISTLNTLVPNGYNLLPGGLGMSGVPRPPEVREKIRRGRLGKQHTQETKDQIRLKHLGVKASPESKEKNRLGQLGRRHPPEVIEKIRATNIRTWAEKIKKAKGKES